ncbi:hypothetical protein V8F06_004135 [Rhypophila decipiens]
MRSSQNTTPHVIDGGPSPPNRPVRSPAAPVTHASPSTQTNNDQDGSDRWLTDRIVTVHVGPEEKKWAVHAKLLCSKSMFFDRHFNGDANQDPNEELFLPHEDPKLFALLVRWLYGTAFANSGGTRIFRFAPPDGKDVTVRDYIGLYILGEKIEIMGVKNAAIDALYAYFGPDAEKAGPDDIRHPDLTDIRYAFDNTTPDSHMRRLLIAHALFYLFGKKRRGAPLPTAWEEVLSNNGEIAWAMIKMLSDWKWVMGSNVPDMKIKARQEFHERPYVPPSPGLAPGEQVIKTETRDEE